MADNRNADEGLKRFRAEIERQERERIIDVICEAPNVYLQDREGNLLTAQQISDLFAPKA